jgi:outer membrane protein
MTPRSVLTVLISVTLSVSLSSSGPEAREARKINVGYFEGGKYPVHDQLRNELHRQLELTTPDSIELTFVPDGFRSANWNRDSSRMMARELTGLKKLDLVVTMGPWAVEDLLAAGFTKPIVAMYRYDPVSEGLAGPDQVPLARNVTVGIDPGKMENDLSMLTNLMPVRRLGILFFPSGNERDVVLARARTIGSRLGFEVVTAEGFDLEGTYAFFKAYAALDKKIDALYLPPMWGMDIIKVAQFLKQAAEGRIPTFCSEARYLVDKGALAANSGYTFYPEARYTADKIMRIIAGAVPAELPAVLPEMSGLSLNLQVAATCKRALPADAVSQAYVVEPPLPETAGSYTLQGAVSHALERNPTYLARYDALQAAAEAARQTYSEYLPEVTALASATHFDDNAVSNARDLIDADRYAATLTLTQPLFSLGAIRDIQMAARHKSLKEINLKQAQLDLELGVTTAYLNYMRASELVKVRRQDREIIDRNLEVANTLQHLGLAERADFVRWEDERTHASENLIAARADVATARVLLNTLLNMPGASPIALDTEYCSEDRTWRQYQTLQTRIATDDDRQELIEALSAAAGGANPALRREEVGIDVQRTALRQNTARFYPTVGFRASLNYRDQLAERQSFAEKHNTWSISGYLSLPIFLGFDRIHERKKLKALLSEAEYRKDAVSLEIMGQVQMAAHSFIRFANGVPLSVRSQQLARQNYDDVTKGYEAQKLPILSVLDAQANVLRAELSYVTSRYDYFAALARLVYDIGWSPSENKTTFDQEFYSRLKTLRGQPVSGRP